MRATSSLNHVVESPRINLHPIGDTRRLRCRHRRLDPTAANRTAQAQSAHQPLHGATSHPVAFPIELLPDLARTVHTEVLLKDAPDLSTQRLVAPRPRSATTWIPCSGSVGVIRRWGDRQHRADRLDPKTLPVLLDVTHHQRRRRSSSAWAKYAEAVRRISLALRSSRFSRSNSLIRSRSAVPGVDPDPPRLDVPICATSPPCNRTSAISRPWPTTARNTPLHDSVPPVHFRGIPRFCPSSSQKTEPPEKFIL